MYRERGGSTHREKGVIFTEIWDQGNTGVDLEQFL